MKPLDVATLRQFVELAGERLTGDWVILGGSVTRDVVRFPRAPEITTGDFDVRDTLSGALPEPMQRQLREFSATRASVHLGTRRYRYVEYTGLNDLRHTELVGLGLFAGVTVGKTLGVLPFGGVAEEDDFYTRGHLSATFPIGSSLVHGRGTLETRRSQGAWQDVLADADLVGYGRTELFRSHTLLFRASFVGGWNTTLPYQLSLGGREGVRSLLEDRYPGGRMVRFVFEDRVVLPWPDDTADLGLTFFSDLGRVWPGDAPYGVDSGWQAALGFGLRIGLPRTTRHIWRTDIAFPVGATTGEPIFRVTFEMNQLRNQGFRTPDMVRSRRFQLGPDTF